MTVTEHLSKFEIAFACLALAMTLGVGSVLVPAFRKALREGAEEELRGERQDPGRSPRD